MTASATEKANTKLLGAAETRVTQLDEAIGRIDSNLKTRQYADPDRDKLAKLRADLIEARAATDKEVAARRNLQQAYNLSQYPKKDKDPEVKAKRDALAQVRKDNKPVPHRKDDLVNSVCQPCLDKEVDAIMDCNTPYYVGYGDGGGPMYKRCHDQTLARFSGWDDLIKSNTKTASEKSVLVAMSANEGDLDAVQSYDSEIVSVGAMQKTVSPDGQGQLPRQLREFRDDPATRAVFDRELGSKGYSVGPAIIGKNKDGTPRYSKSDDTLYFTDPQDPKAKPITGPALNTLILNHKDRWKDTLGPFRSLGRQPEFQRKQVLDFNQQLVDSTNIEPRGYEQAISEYVTSELGGALVLDQFVNRPDYVDADFGAALDAFYKDHPKLAKDPSTWGTADRVAYESEILKSYTAVRRGTDMLERATALRSKESGLSSTPGSLKFP